MRMTERSQCRLSASGTAEYRFRASRAFQPTGGMIRPSFRPSIIIGTVSSSTGPTVTLRRCLPLGLVLGALVAAQEIDTVIFVANRKPFTILDEIRDRGERKAFLALYNKRDPGKRRQLAEAFLTAYPQSWLLSQAYEIAAKACIDLKDYPLALRYGTASLRLLPENPLLLAPLAN